ncbi:MAG: FtsQ-type POTRA domain-containing protein [Clostridia bacterium]|nr:FtsQ-type POTRA domain-containing protein [Clostridia bacterium]
MKYKKLLVLITCLLFVTVAVFCFASAFKVTDIELNVSTVSGSSENIDGLSENYLKNYKGKNLIFVNKKTIESDLTKLSGYLSVVSIDKAFPNKISVTVKEKSEQFAIKSGNDYYVLDGEFCVLNKKQTQNNNVTGGSNLLVNLSTSDYSSDIKIGEKLKFYDGELEAMISSSLAVLNEYKNDLSSVDFTVRKDGLSYKSITLNMKEGVTFTILKADDKTVDKLNATYTFYLALENKGEGSYITVLGDDGNISIRQ